MKMYYIFHKVAKKASISRPYHLSLSLFLSLYLALSLSHEMLYS